MKGHRKSPKSQKRLTATTEEIKIERVISIFVKRADLQAQIWFLSPRTWQSIIYSVIRIETSAIENVSLWNRR